MLALFKKLGEKMENEKKIVNNGFTMWANYVTAIDNFTNNDDKLFGRFMRIICNYAIYGENIAETDIEKLFISSISRSIEAGLRSVEYGKRGGRGNIKADTSIHQKGEEL